MKRAIPDYKLTSYEELLGYKSDEQKSDCEEEIKYIPLSELHTFKNHPFKVLDDKNMTEMIESIRESGVLNPIQVRIRPEGGYEIISGHRRKYASMKLGLREIPAIIREYSDDEAVIAMIDMNIQREEISHSEKAKAYRIKYEVLKHQGKKMGRDALEEMAEASGENKKKIQRYLWLSRLSEELLELVDLKRLGFSQGVDISFLNTQEQKWVFDALQRNDISLTTFKSSKLKEYSQQEKLSEQLVEVIVRASKPTEQAVTIDKNVLKKLFGNNYSKESVEQLVIHLLEEWIRDHPGISET